MFRVRGALRRLGGRRVTRGAPRHAPVPFVVGVTRSGSTLLRLMLDAHPQMAIPPETYFVPDLIKAARRRRATPEELLEVVTENRHWGDFALDADELLERFRGVGRLNPGDALRAFFILYAERHGKSRWGDKTPGYVKRMRQIQAALPEARFVHMIRDGRDAALSREDRRLRESPPMEKIAERWKKKIVRARRDAAELDHYMEIRYEDLVLDPESTLHRACEFIELPFDAAMLTYYERAEERLEEMARDLPAEPGRPRRPAEHRLAAHVLTSEPPRTERVARWRTQMSDEDRAAFESAAGDLLAQLGYEVGAGGGSRRLASGRFPHATSGSGDAGE
jgi:hypothetical protein